MATKISKSAFVYPIILIFCSIHTLYASHVKRSVGVQVNAYQTANTCDDGMDERIPLNLPFSSHMHSYSKKKYGTLVRRISDENNE